MFCGVLCVLLGGKYVKVRNVFETESRRCSSDEEGTNDQGQKNASA